MSFLKKKDIPFVQEKHHSVLKLGLVIVDSIETDTTTVNTTGNDGNNDKLVMIMVKTGIIGRSTCQRIFLMYLGVPYWDNGIMKKEENMVVDQWRYSSN